MSRFLEQQVVLRCLVLVRHLRRLTLVLALRLLVLVRVVKAAVDSMV